MKKKNFLKTFSALNGFKTNSYLGRCVIIIKKNPWCIASFNQAIALCVEIRGIEWTKDLVERNLFILA